MDNGKEIRKHDRIKKEIVSAFRNIGVDAIQEHAGKGWRADVFVMNNERRFAFEIQLSPQTLWKTLDRQAKYIRDGITGCWLFENPVSNLNEERPDLPLFYVEGDSESELIVNLGDRRKIDLQSFLQHFISNNIQFRQEAKPASKQLVNLVFYEMDCWKCNALNHLFYVQTPFYSACHAKLRHEESLWESNSIEYRPEIIELAQKFAEDRKDLNLRFASIKKRFSNTVGESYTSFGCYKCDSIFGDFYVMDAKMDLMYGPNELTYQGEIELISSLNIPAIPHWCFPDDNQFCGDK